MNLRLWPLVLLAVAACYPPVAPPPLAPAPAAVPVAQKRWPDASEASLAEGHKLFISNCNRCHGYPDLLAFSAEKLEKEVRAMAKDEAKLDDKQTELVVRFALTAREQHLQRPG